MNDKLRRLAHAAGIESGYWDGLGVRRDLTETTARALLRALGSDPDGDLEAQAQALEDAAWTRVLPAVMTVKSEAPAELELSLTGEAAADVLDWTITLESGEIRSGQAQPQARNDAGERNIGGVMRGRHRLDLGVALPAGYHRLQLPALDARCVVIAMPGRCHIPPFLADGGRCWGLAIQLYALRSERNWGIGDFTDLACIARTAGKAGAALIGVNPMHARHLARPDEASPYAPSSRLMLDPLYIDVEAVADFADCKAAQALAHSTDFRTRIAAARDTALVDHVSVSALKLPVLRALHQHFRQRASTDPQVTAFRDFVHKGGADLACHAAFEALRFTLQKRLGQLPGWRDWPEELRSPDSPAVHEFCVTHADEVEFQQFLQWQAEMQLAAAAEAAREAGMRIGLYRDLAVGAADDGAECWGAQSLFSSGASVGAPPDMLNREGQDWGLPPWKPRALEAATYAPMAALLSANMRSAGALRIDHVMALTRLFWIPAGMKGAAGGYVRNAFDMLAGIVALESRRNACMVVGEDLGSVPDGLRESLAERGLLSYRVLQFERHWQGDGAFKHPDEYPAQALATAVTHDMPTIAEYWSGEDIDRRAELGLFPEPQLRDAEAARREPERCGLLDLLARIGQAPASRDDIAAVTASLHSAVGMTRAMLAVVQLDDIAGEVLPINIPGTYREYPNWRRKVSLSVEALATDPRWTALAAAMRAAGR
jgi:4-alpha-glucanotransferase